MQTRVFHVILAALGMSVAGCSGTDTANPTSEVGGSSVGGDSGTGGATAASLGGSSHAAGSSSLGGTSVLGVGGNSTGGIAPTGGANNTGGLANTGGLRSTGGAPVSTGGTRTTGGAAATGGSNATGGMIATGGKATGGIASTGGTPSTGGALSTGGAKATGGVAATGGSKNTGGMVNTGGATNGGAATYMPCPTNGDPCKILPLGDSITWGIGYDGAYRVELFSKAIAGQKKITFTGSLSNGPATVANTAFPQRNEGHSGWTIAQDQALVPSPAMTTANGGIPHIVLVHLGTNDLAGSTAQAMATRLGTLIDTVVAAAPSALVVVAKIIPIANATSNNTATAFNALIPGVVATKGSHVTWVDLNTGFTTSMLGDGVHPTQAGYNWMGDKWYAAISSVLP